MPDPLTRARMQGRRIWFLLREFRWVAILALLCGLATVVLALTHQDIRTVQAVGILALVLAVLSIKEI